MPSLSNDDESALDGRKRAMMSRRTVLVAAGVAMPVLSRTAIATDEPAAYLGATGYIDKESPAITQLARDLTRGLSSDRERALAIFGFVKNRLPFGFASGFWDQRASQVLRAGRGYCNTKSTLFVALMRSAGVPARQVFVDIRADVLFGLIDPGTPYVDHSYSEIYLDGAWRATDAYIVDDALFEAAQQRVRRENRLLGFGVHATGTNRWDGMTPAFAQWNTMDPRPIGTRRWGVFADVGDFYARAEAPWNRLNNLMRWGFGALAASANAKADALRSSVMSVGERPERRRRRPDE